VGRALNDLRAMHQERKQVWVKDLARIESLEERDAIVQQSASTSM
jgi:hypothetical protein